MVRARGDGDRSRTIAYVTGGRGLGRLAGIVLSAAAVLTLGRAADAAPVFMATPAVRVTTCVPGYQQVTIPSPSVAGATSVSGQVVVVNGTRLANPIALTNGSATLPLGLHEIAWTATASDGTATTFRQALRVEENVSTACCTPGQTHVQGTDAADALIKLLPKPWCVLAAGGPDVVTTGAKADFISGGDDDDALSSLGGADTMSGGRGADAIVGAAGVVRLYGGPGADLLDAKLSSSATIFGDEGDDLIFGSPGNDVIVPGPGRDTVTAGAGNDRVEILDISEVKAGEILSGGAGTDTLVTPVPLAQLIARGAIVTGFENIVVDATRSYLSESVTGSPLVVTATPGPMRISLDWAWLGGTGQPATFDVLRSLTGSTGTYTTIASGVTGGTFTDDTLRNGIVACYQLVATSGGTTVTSTPVCSAGTGALTAPVELTATPFDYAVGRSDFSARVYVSDLPGASTSPGTYSYALTYQFEITGAGQDPDDRPTRIFTGAVPVAAPGELTLTASWDGTDGYARQTTQDVMQLNVREIAFYRGPVGLSCSSARDCLAQGFQLISGTACGLDVIGGGDAVGGILPLDGDWCPTPPFPDLCPSGCPFTFPLVPFPKWTAGTVVGGLPLAPGKRLTTSVQCSVTPYTPGAPHTDLGNAVQLADKSLLILFGDTDPLSFLTPHQVNGIQNDDVLMHLLNPTPPAAPTDYCFDFSSNFIPVPPANPFISPIQVFDANDNEVPMGPLAVPAGAVGMVTTVPVQNQVFGIFSPGLASCELAPDHMTPTQDCDHTGLQAGDVCMWDPTANDPNHGTCFFHAPDPGSADTTTWFPRFGEPRLAKWANDGTPVFREPQSMVRPAPVRRPSVVPHGGSRGADPELVAELSLRLGP